MDSFTIDAVTQADVPELLAMIVELAEFERLAHQVESTEELLRAALFGGQPVASAVLARVSGAMAGYAIYYRTFSTFVGRPGIFLEDIYVRPQFRKAGVGRALLEEVARAGQKLGGGRLEWNALDWNENALRFYRGLGATVMKDWVLLRMNEKDVSAMLKGKLASSE